MLAELAAALRTVGTRLIEWRQSGPLPGSWEGAQFKAQADKDAHELLTDLLSGLDGQVPIVSEESVASQAHERPSVYWLIDPIDGTASYAHGYDGFVTQAALIERARPILSAVYAPATDEMYTAQLGYGSFRNGLRLCCAPRPGRRTLIDNYPAPRGTAATLFADLSCTSYVESGSIGLKICRVADGTADLLMKDVVVRDWDVAAPQLILVEAGGSCLESTGQAYNYTGRFERAGVIAAVSHELASKVVQWIASRVAFQHD